MNPSRTRSHAPTLADMSSTGEQQRMTTTRVAVAVMVGVLAAAAIIYTVWSANQPSDFDCASQRFEYQLGDRAIYEIDSACR